MIIIINIMEGVNMNNEIDNIPQVNVEEKDDKNIGKEEIKTNAISKGKLIFKLILIWILLLGLAYVLTAIAIHVFLPTDDCHGSISCLSSLGYSSIIFVICLLISIALGYSIVKDMHEKYSGYINYSFYNCVAASLIIPYVAHIVIGNIIYLITNLFS